MKNYISKDLKEQILARVQEGKETVVNIASQHGVKANTVYNWISKSLHGSGRPILEISRLKKENSYLKQLLGQLFADLERGKKNRHA